jgi:hypothetical protein
VFLFAGKWLTSGGEHEPLTGGPAGHTLGNSYDVTREVYPKRRHWLRNRVLEVQL